MMRALVVALVLANARGFAVPRARVPGRPVARGAEDGGGLPVPPKPDPAILVSAKDDATQRAYFGGICGGIALGGAAGAAALGGLDAALPAGWFGAFRDFAWPVPLGAIFAAAGVGHFALRDAFLPIVPPRGAWGGLWQVPAPGADALGVTYAEYHCYWSGAAELAGGVGLAGAGLGLAPFPTAVPAFALLLLVAAITPANVYMYTHDVDMGGGPGGPPPIAYPDGHYARAAAQSALLALLWTLAFPPS